MYKLIIEDDEGKTTVVPIMRDEITIGRKEGNNIRLTERNVSRHHARISKASADVFIEDLDSYNGIRVNGDRIQVNTRVSINEGDLIEIGDYHLVIQQEGTDSPGLAGAGGHPEESTQRVSMATALAEGTLPGAAPDEVTSQMVAPPPGGLDPDQTRTEREMPAPAAALHASAPPEATARMPLPAAGEPTPDPEPTRRSEPTAIVRTSDLTASAEEASARVVAVSTGLAGNSYALTKPENVIGRTDDNDVVLDHRSVSRNHAKIVRDGARYTVVDLNSANGVLVNGEEYKRIDLRKGDIIELGHVKLRFVEPGEGFQLSASEIERLKREDTDADGGMGGGSTTVMTSRVKAGGFPVKIVAGAGAGVVVLLIVIGFAFSGGPGGKDPKPATSSGGAVTPPAPASAAPPEDHKPPDDRKPPRNPPRDPAPTPAPTPMPAPVREDPVAEAQRQHKAALDALRKGNFVEAKEICERVQDLVPKARECLEQVDREIRAQRQLEDAMGLCGTDPVRCYRQLLEVIEGTRARDRALVEARNTRAQIIKKWLKDGEAALQQGDWQSAKTYSEDVLDLDKGNKDAQKLLDKALRLKARSSAQPARPTPQPTPRPSPTPADNAQPAGGGKAAEAKKLLEDGNRAILLGNFDDAVQKGKTALKLDPSLTDAHKLLGVAYARQAKYCEAKTHYKKYVELNPGSPMVDRIKQILQGPELQNCP
ncbi:MAG: FHA domain-containing protein [Deltaproteobacteria bacterium]|nr:FHA domain-containing protein [Deltaproteobacteria bacterium]